MKTKVSLQEWNGIEFVNIECDTLSRAIAIIGESDNCVRILITCEDSTGELMIEYDDLVSMNHCV